MVDNDKISQCPKCKKELKKRLVRFITKKGKGDKYPTFYCGACDMYILKYISYKQHKKDWIVQNPENLLELEQRRQEYLKSKKEAKRQRKQEKREKLLAEARRRAERERELEQKKTIERQRQLEQQKLANKNQKDKMYQPSTEINVKDFVVRRSTFKCLHNEHKLQNIDATICISDEKCNDIKVKVSAGFCTNCNIYFIMEHTYQKLKKRGVLQCRISDEKTYLSNNVFANGMRLAQESVLMQYGYNVSQKEGLTDAQRRKILSSLVDYKILTRNDIISYLDFFINQRQGQSKFEKAIDKWESDKDFISEYRLGSFAQYGVNALFRYN